MPERQKRKEKRREGREVCKVWRTRGYWPSSDDVDQFQPGMQEAPMTDRTEDRIQADKQGQGQPSGLGDTVRWKEKFKRAVTTEAEKTETAGSEAARVR